MHHAFPLPIFLFPSEFAFERISNKRFPENSSSLAFERKKGGNLISRFVIFHHSPFHTLQFILTKGYTLLLFASPPSSSSDERAYELSISWESSIFFFFFDSQISNTVEDKFNQANFQRLQSTLSKRFLLFIRLFHRLRKEKRKAGDLLKRYRKRFTGEKLAGYSSQWKNIGTFFGLLLNVRLSLFEKKRSIRFIWNFSWGNLLRMRGYYTQYKFLRRMIVHVF